jgi:cytochrome c5
VISALILIVTSSLLAMIAARQLMAGSHLSSNPMQAMMRRMMRGLVPPPGISPEALPDPESEGAALMVRYCVQCHDMPSPRYKTAGQWPVVYERMLQRMEMMSGGMMGGGMMGGGMMMGMDIEAPSAKESRQLLAYLQAQGMREAHPSELEAGPPDEVRAYREVCTRCHVLPSPSLHKPGEWAGVVARMEINMRLMNRPAVESIQREAIVRFLDAASRSTRDQQGNKP